MVRYIPFRSGKGHLLLGKYLRRVDVPYASCFVERIKHTHIATHRKSGKYSNPYSGFITGKR
jgi:hypothetical protein